MKELLVHIASSLVDDPSLVEVTEDDRDGAVILKLRVGPEDMGKVIGKQGRIARSIRTLIKAAAITAGKKVNIEIQ